MCVLCVCECIRLSFIALCIFIFESILYINGLGVLLMNLYDRSKQMAPVCKLPTQSKGLELPLMNNKSQTSTAKPLHL